MAAVLLALALPLAQGEAEEGSKIVTAMLLVGLVFIAVIVLGELSRMRRHRRR